MAAPSSEIRQQFLLQFTRTLIETLAAQQPKEAIIAPEEIAQPVQIKNKTFPSSQTHPQISFITAPSTPQKSDSQPKSLLVPATNTTLLKALLEDSSINAVECQGPAKQLVLRKQGATILSQVTLSESDIQKQIEQWSNTTNTPISNGVLRANNENLTITAVISELIGSRFIVIRKPHSAYVR